MTILQVNQAVEDFVGMKVMLHEIAGEEKEVKPCYDFSGVNIPLMLNICRGKSKVCGL